MASASHAQMQIQSGAGKALIVAVLRKYTYVPALGVAVCLLIANLVAQPNFGWTQQLAALAPFALAAMASAPAVISGRGGFDVSISPLMVFTNIAFVAWRVPAGLGGLVAVPLIIAIGAAIGALNGLAIVLLRLQPVVATLCSYFIITGINYSIIGSPVGLTGKHWITDLSGSLGFIPAGMLVILAPLLVWIVLHRFFAFGGVLLAVGGNDTTAFSSGVNVALVRVATYGLGGAFAGLGGLALTSLVQSADSGASTSYTLVAVAAVAIGGTALGGGRGGLFGPLCGAAVIYLLQNLLSTLQVPQTWIEMSYGLLLLVAVVLGSQLSMIRATP